MVQIALKEKFISVNYKGKKSFGGNQEWFESTKWKNVRGQGCGLISAIDTALYFSGVEELTIKEYNSYVDQFLSERKMTPLFLHEFRSFALGVIPIQIAKYLNHRMKIFGSDKRFHWNGVHGHWHMYDKIKKQLLNNMPVIWALYARRGRIKMYVRLVEDGPFVDKNIYVNSHYVTITGLVENESPNSPHKRMVEISSWGKKFYIDYDEYEKYVGTSLISKYCSNIMILK